MMGEKSTMEYKLAKDRMVSRRKIKQKNITSTIHYHEEYELYYMLDGSTTYFIGSEIYSIEKGNFVFLTCLQDSLKEKLGFSTCKLVKTFKGSELEGIKTTHPMYDRDSIIILGDHVTADAGTGCVHTAPGHGADDFVVGTKYK